jgi:hypothetical protein
MHPHPASPELERLSGSARRRDGAGASCPNHAWPLYAAGAHRLQGWGCKVSHGTKPSASPPECSGSEPNADRHCCIDRSLVRGLRLVRETRGAGPRAPASRRAGKNGSGPAGRRCGAGQIRVQRRDDFNVAIWLPRQHGARPAPAGTARRPATCQFPARSKPAAGRRDALNPTSGAEEANPFVGSRPEHRRGGAVA